MKIKSRLLGVILAGLLIITCAGGAFAMAHNWVVGRAGTVDFIVRKTDGTVRTDCLSSKFSLQKCMRDGVAFNPVSSTFMNMTGRYMVIYKPKGKGQHSMPIYYSNTSTGWVVEEYANTYDTDDVYTGMAKAATVGTPLQATNAILPNISGMVHANKVAIAAVPTNPLLTSDARIPATVISTSAEVAKDSTVAKASALTTVGTTASSTLAAVLNINNSVSFSAIVPDPMIIPATGTATYRFYAYVFDVSGVPSDPDGSAMNIEIHSSDGTEILSGSMTRTDVGVYIYDQMLSSTDIDQTLIVHFLYSLSAVSYEQARSTTMQKTTGKLDSILSYVAAIPNNPVLTTDTRMGYLTGPVALNSTVAKDATVAKASAMGSPMQAGAAVTLDAEYDAAKTAAQASTALSNLKWTDAKAGYVDAAISGAGGAIDTSAIASAVWDEPLSSHTTTGTAGRKINDVSGAGQVINVLPSSGGGGAELPVKDGGVWRIIKGNSTSKPYDLKMNVSGQTLYFGVKTEAGISKYSIAKRDVTSGLTDSALGTGMITLSMTDTSIPAGTYVGEIVKTSGSPVTAWASVMRFTVIIMDPVVTP